MGENTDTTPVNDPWGELEGWDALEAEWNEWERKAEEAWPAS